VIGDILSVVIGPEGYYAEVTFEGLATGGTYNLGLTGADAEPSGSTPSIVVTSEGYDATGTLGTITRTVYLTRTLRLPYPADPATSVWENVVSGISGSNLVVRVALSEFIYVGDWDGGGVVAPRPVSAHRQLGDARHGLRARAPTEPPAGRVREVHGDRPRRLRHHPDAHGTRDRRHLRRRHPGHRVRRRTGPDVVP
jgi:hypothetical protein